MSRAKLMSIEAVGALAAALRSFEEEAVNALADLDLEVKRALEWLQHDRREYWTQEVRRGWDRVAEARTNLERRMICRATEQRPSALEEKKALELAKRRLETAQEKVQAVRRWSHLLEREMQEYVGRLSQLTGWLQSDLPKALTALKRMSAALEAYVAVPAAPEAAPSAPRDESPVSMHVEAAGEPGEKAPGPLASEGRAARPAESEEPASREEEPKEPITDPTADGEA